MIKTYQTGASGPDLHHDVLLSNIAISAFDEGVDTFIADQIFPMVTVGKQSDKYAIIEKDAFFRVTEARRSPKTEARRIEFRISSESYYAHNFALAGENALEDIANADISFQLRENTTRAVVTDLRRAQEERIANIVTSITNIGSGTLLTGTNKWTDFINSDPMADVTTGHAFIRRQTGMTANTMMIDWDTLMIVRRHPDLLDLFKYTSGGQITDDQLKQVFHVDNMIVGRGIKENDLEGGTSSITNMWGNNVLLAHIEAAASTQTKTLGLRFTWNPSPFGAAFAVSRKREEGAGTRWVEIVEAQHWQDEKVVARDLGYLIGNTL